MLLHPRRHPWKALLRAAFGKHAPGLGHAVMVSGLKPRCSASTRLERHVGYWKAYHALHPHRHDMAPAELPHLHVLHEQLASNCQLAPDTRLGVSAAGLR